MSHALGSWTPSNLRRERSNVRRKLLTALLAAVTAGAASAQVAASFATDTGALRPDRAVALAAISSGGLINSVLAGPGVNEHDAFDSDPMLGEPLVPSGKLWSSDVMAVDGSAGRSFEDPYDIQAQRDVLFHKLDLLLRANTRSSPVYFGVDDEVKFVEHHDYQPGIPVPFGISHRSGQQRLVFFGELAPILDLASTTSLGWGGGIGIRFYFDR
jgi:hypothetical protein